MTPEMKCDPRRRGLESFVACKKKNKHKYRKTKQKKNKKIADIVIGAALNSCG